MVVKKPTPDIFFSQSIKPLTTAFAELSGAGPQDVRGLKGCGSLESGPLGPLSLAPGSG